MFIWAYVSRETGNHVCSSWVKKYLYIVNSDFLYIDYEIDEKRTNFSNSCHHGLTSVSMVTARTFALFYIYYCIILIWYSFSLLFKSHLVNSLMCISEWEFKHPCTSHERYEEISELLCEGTPVFDKPYVVQYCDHLHKNQPFLFHEPHGWK